jgi:ATP-dependent Lhr-like helicase
MAPPSAEGRWSLIADRITSVATDTQWSTAMAQQLLSRYGLVTREVAAFEGLVGGFGAVYDVLKALEDAGRVRRGYFVAGVGATQFALPPALDLLRSLRETPEDVESLVLAATDPANPYGVTLKWPEASAGDQSAGRGPTRTVGALVVLVNGALGAYLPRGGRQIAVWLPDEEPARSSIGRAIARTLAELARDDARGGVLVAEINGQPPAEHGLTPFLVDAGFYPSAMGLQMRRSPIAVEAAGIDPVSAHREARDA